MLLKVLYFAMICHVAGDFSMIEVYGRPAKFLKASTNSSLSWKNCMALCLDTPMCVVAYNKSGCQWFSYMNISAVNQTTASDKQVVAFKIQNSESTCPTGTNPPTFNNQPSVTNQLLYNGMSVNPVNVTYTIKYSKKVWTISYTSKAPCPAENMKWFPRPKQDWCIHLKYSNIELSYNDAAVLCKNDGISTPTGATNFYENSFFLAAANSFKSLVGTDRYVVRIDGARTTACRSTPTSATCKTAKGFSFIDKGIDTISFYDFATNPGAMAKSDSNCLVMVVDGNKAIKTDVQSCSAATNLPAYGLLCGRPAWQ